MTPIDWTNVSRTATFIQHTFGELYEDEKKSIIYIQAGALPLIGSSNDAGVLSVTSKSSSSKSCTLPSLTSTKRMFIITTRSIPIKSYVYHK